MGSLSRPALAQTPWTQILHCISGMGELSWMSKRFAQQVAAVVACDESLLEC